MKSRPTIEARNSKQRQKVSGKFQSKREKKTKYTVRSLEVLDRQAWHTSLILFIESIERKKS